MKDVCTIYIIQNNFNDKVYIGQTWQPVNKRFNAHLKDKKGSCRKLFNAFNKYDRANFYIAVLAVCNTQSEADWLETCWIDIFDSRINGYNLRSGGSRGKHSEESKQKMSTDRKGKMLGEIHPMYGKHHTEETKARMSKSKRGKVQSEKSNHKRSEALKGRSILTEIQIQQIRDGHSQGKSYTILAEAFGISRTTIKRVIKEMAPYGNTRERKSQIEKLTHKEKASLNGRSILTEIQVQQIRESHMQMKSYRTLAKEFDISITTVERVVKKKSPYNKPLTDEASIARQNNSQSKLFGT
jgi:group I intron endonuclease